MTRSEHDAEIEVAGEAVVLLVERAAYWSRMSTLLVADPHFGKAAAFRAAGVPVPTGTTVGTLDRLDACLARTQTRRVIFLGDFLHAREGRSPQTLQSINDWRRAHSTIEMVLVRGNHDARAGDPPRELEIQCVDEPMLEAPFAFTHHPQSLEGSYVVAGHLHPGVRLTGAARESARLPCFWFAQDSAVLPAFGEFTGLANVSPATTDRVWVVAGDSVVRVNSRR
ncbi:MAG TPA: ligase-associated DNA damage response endonuclease PdeM [Gemmatimonadaceae bacterium]|jgi:DNA ligase-associated metallophosphoesterase